MEGFQHPTDYRHYIQKYPEGETEYPAVDIEETFKCRYVSLTNAENPAVKSVYVESYGDHEGDRVWVSDKVLHNSSELTLTLRWRSDECEDVQHWSGLFTDYIAGRKFEYNDTFRPGMYWQFIFKDMPEVKAECLYGAVKYKFISYKLTNFGGKPKNASIL